MSNKKPTIREVPHVRFTYQLFAFSRGVSWAAMLHVGVMCMLAVDYVMWSQSQPIVLGAPVEIIMDEKLPSQKEAIGRFKTKIPLPPKVTEKIKLTPQKASEHDPDAYRIKPTTKPRPLPEKKLTPKPVPKSKPKPQGALKNLQDTTQKPTEKANVRRGSEDGTENDDEIRQILMRQFNNCWNKDTFAHAENARSYVVVMGLTMKPDGRVAKADVISPKSVSDPMYQVAVDEAKNAVLDPRCQPIPLPQKKYSRWKELEIVFDPKVM